MTVKTWTLLFSTLLLVTGCSKSEVVTSYEEVAKQDYVKQQPTQQEVNNQPVPVIFDVVSEEQATTRGAVNSKADLAIEGFSVFAYYTGTSTFDDAVAAGTAIPNLMYNQHVTGSSADGVNYTWSYTPVKYWPNNEDNEGNKVDNVTFFAYGTHANVTQNASDNTKDATGLASGITAISGNGYSGVPYLIYKLDAETVDIGDMRDLLYATGSYNKNKPSISDKISFSFNHALSAFGFGVSGVFNEVARGTNSGADYLIDDNSYIRIEEIEMKVTLPKQGRLSLDGTWTPDTSSESEITFNMDADHIAENLRYTDYIVKNGGVIDVEATTAKAATLLSYGVGRYKQVAGESLPDGFSLSDDDKIPNSGTNAIYQKVGLTGTAQQNLFYFIPASSTGDITFNFTITYHTLTRDSRMLYGIGDVKNVVSNFATIRVAGDDDDDANSKIYMFNLQLGMTTVKVNSVSIVDYYLKGNDKDNEESTPWNGDNVFYYTIPK